MTTCRTTSLAPVSALSSEFLALFDCAFDGIALWDCDPWRIEYANPAFWQLLGAPADAPGTEATSNDLRSGLQLRIVDLLDRFSHDGNGASTVTVWLNAAADEKSMEVRLCRIARGDKLIVGMIVRAFACGPPTERDPIDSARLDPLTGLPDREFLMKRLATLLTGERIADRQFAAVFLDLDNFKQVNDEFGHLIGDDVLREAVRRIAGCLREGDHVARYGGDEFVALVEGVTAAHEVEPVIERIHAALATPILIPGGEVSLSLSSGMALAGEAGGSPEELLAAADRAMYAAKRTAV